MNTEKFNMTQILTAEQFMDIYQKQVKLHMFLIKNPHLQKFQLDLENDLIGLTPIQKCIVLTTKMRENQLEMVDLFEEIKTLSTNLIDSIETLKTTKDIDTKSE